MSRPSEPPHDLGQDYTLERELHERFEAFWSAPPGLGKLTAVNHTTVGRRFVVTGFIFFLLGGMLALLMRIQLAVPHNTFLDFDTYNQLFTMHGTTMMFLFAVPIMEGFAIYLVPKMIGARDMVFPRLGAYGYWCYLFGGLLLYSSFLFGEAPDSGWFMYTPLASEHAPGKSSDFWLLGITFMEISAVTAAVELIVTILKTRAPGMSIQRMPLFAWVMLVVSLMIVFGFPPLILASILMEIERAFGIPFYDAARGGDSLLWQHLFWLFGHPEVYIIFLPAAGVVSMVLPTFAQRAIAGYTLIVLAVVATGFFSFGLWVHHMFATGIPQMALTFFSAASMAVSVPSGIQVFAWIATLWNGRPVVTTPLLFILGFLFIFVLGGLTGVMVATVPFNWQIHDTHFVVAHLHYVLIGGMVFPLFAGLYYWLPQTTGRMLSERLGRLAFWLMFLGFNVIFLPMHLTGLIGMPRRVYWYDDIPGWFELNFISTVGAFVFAAGVLVFLVDVFRHRRRGPPAPDNPWRAGTLEWGVKSPVPNYNFPSIPPVTSRDPLWEQPELVREMNRGAYYLPDPSPRERETLGTSMLGAVPETVIRLPQNTWVPLVTAAFTGVFFVAFLVEAYAVAALGAGLTALTALYWAWRTGRRGGVDAMDAGMGQRLPLHYASPQLPGYTGLVVTILADATLYASLVYSYFFLWLVAVDWPPPGYALPPLLLPAIALGLLGLSSLALGWAQRAVRRERPGRLRLALLLALLLGVGYGALQVFVLLDWGLPVKAHVYPALTYTITGFHLVHLAIAVLMVGFTFMRSLRGYLSPARSGDLLNTALFWHYMVGLWVAGFAVVHLFPYVS